MATVPPCILLLCGSFNPITIAHLRMFEIAKDYLHSHNIARVVRGIVSPVHDSYGKKGLASATHRCNMIREALRTTDWITLDTWECQQEQWLETAKVLTHIQNYYNNLDTLNETTPVKRQKLDPNSNDEVDKNISNYNNSQPIQVKLLCGADVLESFAVPGLWKEKDIADIVGRHGLVVITRNDCNPLKFIYETDVLAEYENNIHVVTEWITMNVSATHIRRALQRDRSVKYLLLDSVIDYIKRNKLYGAKSDKYSLLSTPSPNPDSDILPPPYDIVKASDISPNNLTLEIPVPTHKATKNQNWEKIGINKWKGLADSKLGIVKSKSETFV